MPGIVGTAMTEEDVPIVGTEQGDRYAKSSIPMARFGEPDEVADAVCFLASEEASYVNGETLVVDGGVTHTG
jgi:NAD(P)-dependent dehydrogenase (short-subunit alcohol dehydrogenase family)